MRQVEIIKANPLPHRAFRKEVERLRVAAYCRVSTDSEDQLNSYKSQVQYYTDLISSKGEWDFVGIYADEAITGTQVKKREEFQRLINDCMNGEIDMIITKTISRFARNTLDTLSYVRMLKEKNISIFFEEENGDTLTMDGELLLVILSSVAQQEVENISANVKKGLKMKMQRGEMVGFQGCLGYDYDKESKSLSVNSEEAKVIHYIFNRYIEGAGCNIIARELERLGHKTKHGNKKWAETTVMGIIKNEKYKGDLRQGKTFALDPISKCRLDNFGEEDQFYIRNHHEAIISEEIFEAAQQIIERRARGRKGVDGRREKFSRKYAFSSLLKCGFCGSNLSRRSWHSGTQYQKTIWQCITNTKRWKKFCPDAKGIPEETVEQAFLESYRLLCHNNKGIMDELLKRIEKALCSGDVVKKLAHVEKEISALEQKRKKLVDLFLNESIDKGTYDTKYLALSSSLAKLQDEYADLQHSHDKESIVKKRIATFQRTLEQNEVLSEFDRYVFESIVDKATVGGGDDDENKDRSLLTFIYKTGFTNSVDSTKHKPIRLNGRSELCFQTQNEGADLRLHSGNTTRGVRCIDHTVGVQIV